MTLTLSLNQKVCRTLERQVSTRPHPQVGGPGVYKVPKATPKIPTSGVFSLKEAIGGYYRRPSFSKHREIKFGGLHIVNQSRRALNQSLVSVR